MKKNMVPLLGIAFVVAIISTGVFYGLFAGKLRSSTEVPGHSLVVAARDLDRGTVLQPSDLRVLEVQGVLSGSFSKPEDAAGATLLTPVKENEPLIEERVTPRVSDAARAGGPVPAGMRAVTLHVVESESLLGLLKPGSRVDLQAVADRNGAAELRTVLENVPVLSSVENNGSRPATVTVLVRAKDADMVALADAGSRIRIALRNPEDQELAPHRAVSLAALFSSGSTTAPDAQEPAHSAASLVWDHPMQLRVQVLSVTPAALEALEAKSAEVTSDAAWRLATVGSSEDAGNMVRSLAEKRELEVVSSERLTAGIGRPISYRAGSKPGDLAVSFAPQWQAGNRLALQVKERIGGSSGPPVELRNAGGFLIESRGAGADMAATRLFPGHSWAPNHMVIFVSTRPLEPTSVASAAGGRRRR
jgi:Flp pilus assembly protein CpaB